MVYYNYDRALNSRSSSGITVDKSFKIVFDEFEQSVELGHRRDRLEFLVDMGEDLALPCRGVRMLFDEGLQQVQRSPRVFWVMDQW